jgi:hypothetical protein
MTSSASEKPDIFLRALKKTLDYIHESKDYEFNRSPRRAVFAALAVLNSNYRDELIESRGKTSSYD